MNTDARSPVVVELIGDLDTTLVASLTDMLSGFSRDGTASVLVYARHLALADDDGLVALGSALSTARERGTTIAIDPGSRKMRSAFSAAHIDHGSTDIPRPAGARYYMIARHAEPSRLIAL